MFGTLLLNLTVVHEGRQLIVLAPEVSRKIERRALSVVTMTKAFQNSMWLTGIEQIAFFSDCGHGMERLTVILPAKLV